MLRLLIFLSLFGAISGVCDLQGTLKRCQVGGEVTENQVYLKRYKTTKAHGPAVLRFTPKLKRGNYGEIFASISAEIETNRGKDSFNAATGIAGDWTDVSSLQTGVNHMFLTDIKSLVKICRAYPAFYQCLGADYFDCINPLFLMSQNVDINNSYEYVAIINSIQLRCGEGFDAVFNNQACLANTYNHSSTVLTTCQSIFIGLLNDQPLWCQHLQTLQTCYRETFLNGCGVEAGWLACEIMNYSYDHVNQCHGTCIGSMMPESKMMTMHNHEISDFAEFTALS